VSQTMRRRDTLGGVSGRIRRRSGAGWRSIGREAAPRLAQRVSVGAFKPLRLNDGRARLRVGPALSIGKARNRPSRGPVPGLLGAPGRSPIVRMPEDDDGLEGAVSFCSESCPPNRRLNQLRVPVRRLEPLREWVLPPRAPWVADR